MTSSDSHDASLSASKGNPGVGSAGTVELSNGNREWTEELDLFALAATALMKFDHAVKPGDGCIIHQDTGLFILPQIVNFHILDDSSVRAATTIEIHHPSWGEQSGIFEYQHTAGSSLNEAILNGFEQWTQTDFVAILDSLQTHPASCMMMQMELPSHGDVSARNRRIILGPVMHYTSRPAANTATDEEHAFCPCCLFTNSLTAFQDLLESDRLYGIRLYASRDADGICQADCRVNGEDWPTGVQPLTQYAERWPDRGLEFRKQYVIIQNE